MRKNRIFPIMGVSLLLLAVGCQTSNKVRLTTPRNDAEKVIRMYNEAQTPEQRNNAAILIQEYQQAYSEEVYKGKRSYEDVLEYMDCVKELTMDIGY